MFQSHLSDSSISRFVLRIGGVVGIALLLAAGSFASGARPASASGPEGSDSNLQTVTAANLYDTSFTLIDIPITINNPNAIIFVTANWNPYGIHASSFDNHQIGVWYLSELGR